MRTRRLLMVLAGAGMLGVWLPLLIGGLKSLRARGPFGDSDALIVTGPYAQVRHPLYAGLSMSVIGVGLVMGSRALALGGLGWLAATRLWSVREEAGLAARFGSVYEDYRRATPAMVPGVRRILGRHPKRSGSGGGTRLSVL